MSVFLGSMKDMTFLLLVYVCVYKKNFTSNRIYFVRVSEILKLPFSAQYLLEVEARVPSENFKHFVGKLAVLVN